MNNRVSNISSAGPPHGATGFPHSHLGFLDGIRGLAALYVLAHHAWLTIYFDGRRPDHVHAFWEGWLDYGHFAVDVFIVLSGFCLMIPVAKRGNVLEEGTSSFFKKRIRRILPPYYAALVLSIALATTVLSHKMGTVWDYSLPVTPMGILAHLLLLQNIHRSLEINSVFWSIAVECQIYLLFPLLVRGWSTIGIKRTAGLAIAVGIVVAVILQPTRFAGLTAHYLSLFTFGMIGATICFSSNSTAVRYRASTLWLGISAGFCALVLLCTQIPLATTKYQIGMDILVGLCAVTFIIGLTHSRQSWIHRCLNWAPFVYIGTFSYSLYLVHLPILQLLWQYVLVPAHPKAQLDLFLLILGGLTLGVAFSWLFHIVFERPFMSTTQKLASSEVVATGSIGPALGEA